MEESHHAARAKLWELMTEHSEWSHREMAEVIGYSKGWVRKWRKRLSTAKPGDESVLHGYSRCRHTPYERPSAAVVKRILAIREEPPDNLQRRPPGPKTILYYLKQDPTLRGEKIPQSASTIWRVLREHGYIATASSPLKSQALERPAPLECWQIDFKDITTVPPQADGKKQHVLQALNIVDEGTSFWVDYHLRDDFTAETAILAMAKTFLTMGLPQQITFDRDTRFTGPSGMRDFPAAFHRFVLCLGISTNICPPRRPDKNAYVERLHGTLEAECIQVHKPTNQEQSETVFENFHYHYHHQRPHQGTACNNQPPAQAFPVLPRLPQLLDWVDPDRWIWKVKGKRFVRKVRAAGSITIDGFSYSIKRALAGQYVITYVDAASRELVVLHNKQVFKRLPIKGLHSSLITFEDYLKLITQQARREA